MQSPDVDQLARLARLRLGRTEAAGLEQDLARMLTHFQALEEVDTEGVEPSPYPLEPAEVQREDQEIPGLEREIALADAPAVKDDCYRVPPIIGPGGEA